jgi:peptidoglycan/LPS O-acetylase OafA/YrhL
MSLLDRVDRPADGRPETRTAPAPGRRWHVPTLDARFDGRTNSIGLLRHVLAFAVLLAHSWQVGFNAVNPTSRWWGGQSQLGSMGVFGFFVLSGFLITGSALKLSVARYAWHRFLRIYPGLWACLACSAFLIAPAVALAHGTGLRSFWLTGDGPAQYVTRNFFASMDQVTIAGLFGDTPYGNGHPTTFNAPLWSLRFELLCYVGVGVLALTAVLRRARFVAPVLLCLVWAAIVDHAWRGPSPKEPLPFAGIFGPVPLLGSFDVHDLVILAYLFLLGVCAQLYRRRIPMHGGLAILAAAALATSLWYGGFLAYGMIAYGYLLLYLAVALPKAFSAIGRRWDYSYGIYIYGYPVQLVLAVVGVQRFGLVAFTVAAALGTVVFAMMSWHLVEKRALSLKDVRLVRPARAGGRADPAADGDRTDRERAHGLPVAPDTPGQGQPAEIRPQAAIPPADLDRLCQENG